MSGGSDGTSGAATRPAAAVVLAAGKGTRMRSALPKALHPVGGLSMLGHVVAGVGALSPEHLVVVVGHQAEAVSDAARALSPIARTPIQEPQLGTAHAVRQAESALDGFEGDVFVLYADTPLIRPETLRAMQRLRAEGAGVVVLGFEPEDPTGYGRLVRDAGGALTRIVEEKDASPDERAIRLCNSGVMCLDGARLFDWLGRITDDNAKREFYLTDVVAIARREDAHCAVALCDPGEVLGVNSRADLADAEAAFQRRARRAALEGGATLHAPDTVHFSHDTAIGQDVEIEPNVVFGPGVTVADGVRIRAFSHLEGCRVETGAVIGPYARLRPGAEIGPDARVGNFVEVKNATLARGAKANHLTYLGDAAIGAGANVGAGTITCNYDGYLKHRTEIGAGAFIGSNTALVAPVRVGANANIGAGSTVTENVPDDALAIARARQATRPGLAARMREALSAAKAAGAAPAVQDQMAQDPAGPSREAEPEAAETGPGPDAAERG